MSFSSSLLIPSEGAFNGFGRDKVPDFKLGCTISNVQEDELLAAKVDTATLLGLALDILERYLSVQFRESSLTQPEGLLVVLHHDASHRGMTAGLGLLMLLCRSSQAREVVHTLLSDPILYKSKLSPLGGLQEGGNGSGGLSAGELRSLRTCNRMARCMMMRVVATRASSSNLLEQECLKWRFGNYLVDACRDGEEAEQLSAVDALLSLMPAQLLRGDALKGGAVAALLERLVRLTDTNRQLIDSMTRTIQAYRDARVLVSLTKVKVRELEEQIRATEAIIAQRVTDGKEDDPQLIQHVSSLKLQRSSSEQDGTRAVGVMKDSKTRFAETNGFLEENHRQLQATVLALACLAASDREAKEELCRRLSVALLLSLLDSTPFNLGIHWAVLHLLGTLLLPAPSPNTRVQQRKHALQQDNSLSAGLVAYLMRHTVHAAKAWLRPGPPAEDASITIGASLGAASGSSTTVSDSEASGSSSPPQPKSIEEADAKLKAQALDVIPDMCPQCFSHAMEVLFQCVHGHGDACRAILGHQGGIQALLTVSGIMPGLMAPTSANVANAPGAVTCMLKTDASSDASGNNLKSSGVSSSANSSSTCQSGSTGAPLSSHASRQAARGCDHCRGSQPFVHGTSVRQPYSASLYNLLWASNVHGQAQPLDIVIEIIRHECSGQESVLQEGCLPIIVSTLGQQNAPPQLLVALLNVLTCQLVPAPFPPDTHPGRAYAHNHLDMEDMGTTYHESARQLFSEGVTNLLLDFITGQRLGHLRFRPVGARDVMPVVLAMQSLGRFCLSAPVARKMILRLGDTRRDNGAAEGEAEQALTSGFDMLLLLLLHGEEYVRLADCDIAPPINVKPAVPAGATSQHESMDATIRQEAAGCLASMAWNHKALQSCIAQRGGDELFSVLLACLTKDSSPMLQTQCCRLIVTVVQYAVDVQEKMARKGIVNQLITLLDSPRSSVVIYASQALESCITGCLEAQEQLQQDAQFRALWRVIGNKVVPGGYSSKCAALKALSAILAVHNNNRQKAGMSGLVGPVTKMVRVEDDVTLRRAAIDALEHLIRRHAANWRDVTQVGGVSLLLILCQHATLSTTRSTAFVQLSLLCKHCPDKLKTFLKLQGMPLLLDFVSRTSEDMTNAMTAMQALCALLDHECVREEALQHQAHHVLSSLLTSSTAPDPQDPAPSDSEQPAASLTELAPAAVSTTLQPAMARDACLCLAKLAGESMVARDMLVADTELMALLQSLGAKAASHHLSQAATVGWASLTRGPQFGNLHFSMTGWPDFGEGLRASYTLPVLNED